MELTIQFIHVARLYYVIFNKYILSNFMVLWLLHYRNNNILIVYNKVRYIITDEQILFKRFCKPLYFIFTYILVIKIIFSSNQI